MCVTELMNLLNKCLDTGTFPERWDIGEITPIPKVNIHSKKPEEWRPIITPIKLHGKILERCVLSYCWLSSNKC